MKLLVLALVGLLAVTANAGRITFRVRHGDVAKTGQFPQIVLIHSTKSICTASIVGSNKVLTAGHCVCGKNKMQYVIRETVNFPGYIDDTKTSNVASYTYHPDYEAECQNVYSGRPGGVAGNDIAMITVKENFMFQKKVVEQGVMSTAKPKAGTTCEIAGYGKDENGRTGTLKHGKVVLRDCPRTFSAIDSAICYNSDEKVNRQATGSGDSGGPMLLNGEIVGVTSGKIAWSDGIQIGVHASTSKNMDYINRALR